MGDIINHNICASRSKGSHIKSVRFGKSTEDWIPDDFLTRTALLYSCAGYRICTQISLQYMNLESYGPDLY